ncbi:MAG TPA: hypothetical protein DD979_14610, partial [Gammaproteobacteria bacterium]|nr:hypothetical protein [Gammaproteobacteria bacterium]
ARSSKYGAYSHAHTDLLRIIVEIDWNYRFRLLCINCLDSSKCWMCLQKHTPRMPNFLVERQEGSGYPIQDIASGIGL